MLSVIFTDAVVLSLMLAVSVPLNTLADVVSLPSVLLMLAFKSLAIVVVPLPAPRFNAVAAPNAFTVVAVVLSKLNVVWLVVTSPPLTCRSPFNTVLALIIVNVPLLSPMLIVVAARNALTVVINVSNNVNVPVLVLARVGLAPLILSAVALGKVIVLFLTVAVPVVAPIDNAVAAPAKFIVVGTVFSRLTVS